MTIKKIVLTGGGTAGHVTPNIALLPALAESGFEPHYIGSHTGIERGLIEPHGIPYYGISSGKLRRYMDLKNVSDIFRVVRGVKDAVKVLRRIKPDVVFSKGGFVTVPVAVAARMRGVPVILHESDITPGLANRLVLPFSRAVCCNFPETAEKLEKAVVTGTPIRAELWEGRKIEGLRLCGFDKLEAKPVILFMGGSQGAVAINRKVVELLPQLQKRFHVIHLCGKGNMTTPPSPGYAPFEYANETLPHLLAAAEMVVSRAGANTIFELLALNKPNLLIPLTLAASRGDQILNAVSFEKQGFSMVLQEDEIEKSLYASIEKLYADRRDYVRNMSHGKSGTSTKNDRDGTKRVMEVIERWTTDKKP